jgi:hypothetical protein
LQRGEGELTQKQIAAAADIGGKYFHGRHSRLSVARRRKESRQHFQTIDTQDEHWDFDAVTGAKFRHSG